MAKIEFHAIKFPDISCLQGTTPGTTLFTEHLSFCFDVAEGIDNKILKSRIRV